MPHVVKPPRHMGGAILFPAAFTPQFMSAPIPPPGGQKDGVKFELWVRNWAILPKCEVDAVLLPSDVGSEVAAKSKLCLTDFTRHRRCFHQLQWEGTLGYQAVCGNFASKFRELSKSWNFPELFCEGSSHAESSPLIKKVLFVVQIHSWKANFRF